MKFRKKPVVIEAIQYTHSNIYEVSDFMSGIRNMGLNSDGSLSIVTLEGVMKVSINDWVIKGVQGEFYPCKPDIFDQTYEPVDLDQLEES